MSDELERGIPKAITIGKNHYTEEEREQHDKSFERILKKYGVLKQNQSIKEWKQPE